MAYGLRYQAQIFWVGPGAGPMSALNAPSLPGSGGGTGQLAEFGVNPASVPVIVGTTTFTPPGGSSTSGALAAADITTLTNAMAADIAAQLNLPANLAKVQGWVAGLA